MRRPTHVMLTMLLIGAFVMPSLLMLSTEELNDSQHGVSSASGRQDLDVDCSGYTFEDLFVYDFALFELGISDDWANGDLYANSWVNGSNAAIVRDNLDSLFDGIPGGNNDWISTEERDAVRGIGPKCIADMDTRIGMREGIPHSGGVDWNDFEFVESGLALDEVNLVPTSHTEARQCTNFGAAPDCKEVPTSITDDLEISLDIAEGEAANVRFDQLPNQGSSNFTLALNITNMSNAALVVTFPVLQGLRMYDARVVDNNPDNDDTTQACDYLTQPSSKYLSNGALQVTQLVQFDRTQWELQCFVFLDFTTEEPLTNDAPIWLDDAPENGTKFATMGSGSSTIALAKTAMNWASDDNGWSLECTFDQTGWSLSTNVLGDVIVTQPENSPQAMATCIPVDPLGEKNENDSRMWSIGTLFNADAIISESGDSAVLTLTPTGFVDEFTAMIHAHQGTIMGPASNSPIVSQDAVQLEISLNSIRPGMFMFMGSAQAVSMIDFDFAFSLGLMKPNTPPTLEVAVNFDGKNATWDASGVKFSMYGLASDPDGEAVTLSLTICGSDPVSNFNQQNINWDIEVSIAICMQYDITDYTVQITATDESGGTTIVSATIDQPIEDVIDVVSPITEEKTGALPFVSFMSVVCVIAFAALVRRRA